MGLNDCLYTSDDMMLPYLIALRTWEIFQASHMDLESMNVESSLGGKLLITVGTFSNIGWNAEHGLGLDLFLLLDWRGLLGGLWCGR